MRSRVAAAIVGLLNAKRLAKELRMATQKVLDHTGHSTHQFSAADKVSVKEAETRFNALKGQGYVAFTPGANGTPGALARSFDPNAEETVFHPALVGG